MPAVRLQHGHQHADDAGRREVLAAALALGGGELADEVLVDPADQVLAAVVLPEDVLGEQVDQAGDVLPLQVGAGVDARQQAPELVGVGLLQQLQDVVEPHLDVVGLGLLADVLPAGLLGDDERAGCPVLVRIGEGVLVAVVLALRLGDQASSSARRFS